MKLLLVHAWNEKERAYRSRFSSLLSYPSLTLAVIYSLIPKGAFERIDVVDENSQKVRYDRERYDLVMISFDTSSSITAYKHCEQFRRRGAYVVCGGYHATALPDEVAKHCDTVIAGPAEISVPEFIADFLKGEPKKFYKNVNVCPAKFPIPARDKITMRKKLKIPTIIANRGCPNHCIYCSMRVMWKHDPRPVENVIAEIKSLKSKMLIFFDPNFFVDRDYALALMSALKPLKILWACNATADLGYDEELLKAARDSGCRGLLIGLESVSSKSLKGAGKRFNNADKYKEIIANIHKYGIAVIGCFVMGFDGDTERELRSLPRRVDRLGLDLCRFSVLTPYPGTPLFDKLKREGRILTEDWSRYRQHNAVFKPANLTPQRLDALYRQVWREAYTWRRMFKRTFSSPWRNKPYVFVLLGANIGFKFLGINGVNGKKRVNKK